MNAKKKTKKTKKRYITFTMSSPEKKNWVLNVTQTRAS